MFRRLETFTAGVQIVAPLPERHGFHFEGESVRRHPSIVGLGEDVAFGEFIRGDRRLLVELFYSLGPVKYYVGELWLEHEPYIRAVGVPSGQNAYPGVLQRRIWRRFSSPSYGP
jgi:hypothetical protein